MSHQNNSFDKQLGHLLLVARKRKLETREETAENAILSPSHLGTIERGEKLPNIYTFYRIWKALEFDAEELFKELKNMGEKNNE